MIPVKFIRRWLVLDFGGKCGAMAPISLSPRFPAKSQAMVIIQPLSGGPKQQQAPPPDDTPLEPKFTLLSPGNTYDYSASQGGFLHYL